MNRDLERSVRLRMEIFFAGVITGSVIGIVYGLILFKVLIAIKSSGILRIDCSETPNLFLELTKEIKQISDKKHIILEIEAEKFTSQK